jgi:hypothetical protein
MARLVRNIALIGLIALAMGRPAFTADPAIPKFQIDASWPKTLPNQTANWRASFLSHITQNDPGPRIVVSFDIANQSPTVARLESIEIHHSIGETARHDVRAVNATVGTQHDQLFSLEIGPLDHPQQSSLLRDGLAIQIWGQFTYTDLITRPRLRKRVKHFARVCVCRKPERADSFTAEFQIPEVGLGKGSNDEETWNE